MPFSEELGRKREKSLSIKEDHPSKFVPHRIRDFIVKTS
jgi:hypothetical protein